MARTKTAAVSDEAIVAALISTGKATAAAKVCGISARTIYSRMHTYNFAELYAAAKTDILRSANNKLTGHLGAAIDTIAEIMANDQNNAAVRLQAAQTIISNAVKLAECLKEGEAEATEAAKIAAGAMAFSIRNENPPDLLAEEAPAADMDEITGKVFGSE